MGYYMDYLFEDELEVSMENLGREWIGIDVSPTACRVMAKRLPEGCVDLIYIDPPFNSSLSFVR